MAKSKEIKKAVSAIKKIFDDTKRDKIRYGEIEHIDCHHEALHEMEDKSLVTSWFHGHKVYIEKNIGW